MKRIAQITINNIPVELHLDDKNVSHHKTQSGEFISLESYLEVQDINPVFAEVVEQIIEKGHEIPENCVFKVRFEEEGDIL